MLRALLYLSFFASVLIAIRPIRFEAFDFLHGYLESTLLTIGVVMAITITNKKLMYLNKITQQQSKFMVLSCYLVLLVVSAYVIKNTFTSIGGGMESTALYTFKHFTSWSGEEITKLLHPWVGVTGFVLTCLTFIRIKSQTLLRENFRQKIFSFIPLILFYTLLSAGIKYISVPISQG